MAQESTSIQQTTCTPFRKCYVYYTGIGTEILVIKLLTPES